MIKSGGGCTEAIIVHYRTASRKFKELLPLLTSIFLRNRGKVFRTYVQRAPLHAGECCCALRKNDLLRLKTNEHAMMYGF